MNTKKVKNTVATVFVVGVLAYASYLIVYSFFKTKRSAVVDTTLAAPEPHFTALPLPSPPTRLPFETNLPPEPKFVTITKTNRVTETNYVIIYVATNNINITITNIPPVTAPATLTPAAAPAVTAAVPDPVVAPAPAPTPAVTAAPTASTSTNMGALTVSSAVTTGIEFDAEGVVDGVLAIFSNVTGKPVTAYLVQVGGPCVITLDVPPSTNATNILRYNLPPGKWGYTWKMGKGETIAPNPPTFTVDEEATHSYKGVACNGGVEFDIIKRRR